MAKSHRAEREIPSRKALSRHLGRTGVMGRRGMTRQEAFCRNLVLHEMMLIVAYRQAFDWKGSDRKAENAANQLLDLPAVQQRLRELRAERFTMPNGGRSMLTLEEHLGELALIQREAALAGQYGPAVTACIARGKASGLLVDRTVTAHVSLEDLIAASRHALPDAKDLTLERPQQLKRLSNPKRSSNPPPRDSVPDDD